MSATILPVCCHCGNVPRGGLYNGIRLRRRFICRACECRLLRTEQNSPDYLEFMATMRALMFGV
ncbi:MAG: sigma factor G inhibitor Gin [Peptococcaceae bacterium]|jgi:hypothetical protein|nr:sigma factor G inhibitor Gin [Peptococcaceae bacterium]